MQTTKISTTFTGTDADWGTMEKIVWDSQLEKALHHFTTDLCLCISPSLPRLCKSVTCPPLAQREALKPIEPDALSTWWCYDSRFFTLIKGEDERTLLYSHSEEALYYASANAQLAPGCPANTGFLCQFTVDKTPEGDSPRLLAFDVISADPPAVRGETLRALAVHFPQPHCHVQWVGPRRFLSKVFVSALPHLAREIFCLGPDPLVLERVESI